MGWLWNDALFMFIASDNQVHAKVSQHVLWNARLGVTPTNVTILVHD